MCQNAMHVLHERPLLLCLGLVSYVDYSLPAYSGEGTGQFAMEMEVIGNINTHELSIRTIRRNLNTTIGNGYAMDMVGKGISKGAENFFLLRAKDNGDVIAPTYFCVPADPTADQLKAVHGTTDIKDAALDNCAAYRADVEVLSFFNESEVPLSQMSTNLAF